jgi:hypothetical protein
LDITRIIGNIYRLITESWSYQERRLLKEYETCQAHTNAINSQFWTSMSVYLSINILVIGGLVGSLINRGGLLLNAKWLVLVLGVASFLIALWIWLWQKRVQHLTGLNNDRMKRIECLLPNMKAVTWRISDGSYKKKWIINAIFGTVEVLWIIIIVMSFTMFN